MGRDPPCSTADYIFLDLYYLSFPRDRWTEKALVLFVYLLETAQTLLMTNDCWNVYVKSFADIVYLLNGTLEHEWLTVPIFTAIGKSSIIL